MDEIEKLVEEKANSIVESETANKNTSAVDAFKQQVAFKLDVTKTPEEQAKDIIGVRATAKAIEDDSLTRGVTDRKKAEILNHADAHLKKEEAENKKAEILLQEANYGVYNGVATYAGIKKPLPQKMQSVLFSILSAFQLIVLLAIGFPISIINISLDCVDSVIQKMRNVTKSARWIVFIILLGLLVWLGIVIIRGFVLKP